MFNILQGKRVYKKNVKIDNFKVFSKFNESGISNIVSMKILIKKEINIRKDNFTFS